MTVRKYKPTTPGRRGASVADFVEVTKKTPEKSLLAPTPRKGGRNVHGRMTTRHQGGGHKQRYRVIDFRREKDGVPAKVRGSSTTPTAPPASPCSTTPTARSATSSPPRALRSAIG